MEDLGILQFGSFTIDLSRQVLRLGDRELALRPQSFDVLRYLAERAGTMVSKDQLIEAVWDRRPASDDSVTQCIKDIRQALGDGAHDAIKTFPKRGYLFAAEITRTSAVRKAPPAPMQSHDTEPGPRVFGPLSLSRRILTSSHRPVRGSRKCVGRLARSTVIPTRENDVNGHSSVTVLPFARTNDLLSQKEAFSSIAANIATELTATGRGFAIQVKTVEARDVDTGPVPFGDLAHATPSWAPSKAPRQESDQRPPD